MAERWEHWREVGFRNAMREQYDRIRDHYPRLQDDFIAHARAYGQKLYPELQNEPEFDPQLQQGIEHER
ncbi:MAG: hypothetical protein AAF526_08420 [Pseudomonadota bacterium]